MDFNATVYVYDDSALSVSDTPAEGLMLTLGTGSRVTAIMSRNIEDKLRNLLNVREGRRQDAARGRSNVVAHPAAMKRPADPTLEAVGRLFDPNALIPAMPINGGDKPTTPGAA